MSPPSTLTLALAALQDTGVPRNQLQLDAIETLRQAIQDEKAAPKKVFLQDVVDTLMQHHRLAAGTHSHFEHIATVIQTVFGK